MKTLSLLTAAAIAIAISGCAYDGPMIGLTVGFMGASAGVTIGGQPPSAVALQPQEGLRK